MSKFMQIAGILAAAAGVAVILMAFFSTAQMQILGLTVEAGAIFLTGGLLMVGIGGTIGAIDSSTRATADLREWLIGHEAAAPADYEPPAMRAAAPTTAAVAAVAAASYAAGPEEESPAQIDEEIAALKARADEMAESARASTQETLDSLDQAKADIAAALDLGPVIEGEPIVERQTHEMRDVTPEPEPQQHDLDEEDAGEDDDQLFVVEEKLIRGRPARVLSDGTVEAETDEGWMRFENLEHLEEYLDAMSPVKA